MFGPLIAYLPTPRTRDGEVAVTVLRRYVERAVAAGVGGVAVLGSAGGFAYLEPVQRRSVVETAAEAAGGRVPLLAGIGALRTAEVHAHAAAAEQAGADALLLPTMSYLPLVDDEVVGLYRDVAGAARRPVWAYHNPRTTGVHLSLDVLATVAALPGIGGLKDRGADPAELTDRCAHLLARVPEHVEVGYSGDAFGYRALAAGARSWHSGLAGLLPEPFVAVAAAAAGGDVERADELARPLTGLAELGAQWGVARLAVVLGEVLGLPVGPLPAPLLPPPSAVRDEAERLLAAL